MGNVPTVDTWGDIFTLVERGATEQVADRTRRDPALVHARRDDGATPLHVAAASGHKEVVSALLAHGADIDARDNLGYSPVSLAARFIHGPGAGGWADHAGVTAFLLDYGAPLDVWAATVLDRADALDALLRADPRLANASGLSALTPLHWAAYHGHAAVVDLLLAYGADTEATDPYLGKTPLQWARDAGHDAIVARLQRHDNAAN